ncbi:MAG: uncharacterized protein PWR01_4049 [Clostridiales bacterium]|jgi:predicted CoA-binding protein|nr:uncharacterized protein [Clostridiales bacterium]MDN5282976.1 uncharacterized protein [Candidatus Ozemobacter sp.]
MKNKKQNVAVLGASPRPERYSNKAVKMLLNHGHNVIPLHLSATTIENIKVLHDLDQIDSKIDTLTIYVSPEHLQPLEQKIISLNPARIIFNPGSENSELINNFRDNGIEVIEACTLVLLSTGQF